MIRVNATLFRIANLSVSTEETRYYLNGVFVEPHHSGKGATLTATDGHRLVSLYDETGHCDAPAIVKLSAEALKSSKPHKSDPDGSVRVVHVDVVSSCGNATIAVGRIEPDGSFERLQTVAVSERCIINGHFPDYRQVVKGCVGPCKGKVIVPGFNPAYVASFCDIAAELHVHNGGKRTRASATGSIVVTGAQHGEAALISFPEAPIAFGLLMPMRTPNGFAPVLPAWFGRPQLQAAA